jgi:EmrB/QacA subfamily drug resistance transporter
MTASTERPAAVGFDRELIQLAAVVVAGAVMTVLDTTIMNVAIGTLGRQFGAPLSTIQWVLTGYTLALAATIPITGWAMERFGGKTMWLVSLGLFIGGSMACGLAWSAPALIAFRVVQGAGGGMLLPVGQTMLVRAAGPARMGRVMTFVAVPAMLAPVLGPVLGGLIVDNLDWRWLFYVNVPLCAVALVLAIRLLPADTERRPARLDGTGLALLGPGLALLVYGLSRAAEPAGLADTGLLLGAGLGALLITGFCWHALRRTDQPLVDLRLFRHRPLSASVGTLFLYSAGVFGVMIVLPLYAQLVRHDSPLQAGVLLAPLGLGAMVTMPISGRITDRYGPARVALAGIAVAAAGILAYTPVGATTGRGWLLAAAFVVGLGHGLLMPAIMAAAYLGLGRAAVPAATTLFNVAIRVASSAGTALLAVVLQASLRSQFPGSPVSAGLAESLASQPGSTGRLATAFGHTFWWALVITAAALLPALLVPARKVTPAPPAELDE